MDGGARFTNCWGIQTLVSSPIAAAFPWLRDIPSRVLAQLLTEVRYDGYLPRQQAEIRSFQREESVALDGVAFGTIGGLSTELSSKLADIRPASLGAASRIQGMTPAALAAIAAHVRKSRPAVAAWLTNSPIGHTASRETSFDAERHFT